MEEQGMVIFEDGTTQSFGNYVCPDEKQFMHSPSAEASFIREIASTEKFKECNLFYIYSMSFYDNISYFCSNGLIIILNSQETTISPTSIKVFLPENPTEEQKKALEENEKLAKVAAQDIYEFSEKKPNNYVQYNSIDDYIKNSHRHR